MANKTDLCGYCEHPRSSHHKGCNLCDAENRHGHYCENFLCCCTDYLESDALTDDDLAALMEQA